MIGLFDSGLGGLTVFRHLRALLPQHDVLYFADQAHVPYGDRRDDDLLALLARNLGYLESAGADAVVMACNTSCAVAATYGWPQTRIPVLDLIASAAAAVVRYDGSRIGVVATAATVRSGAYSRAIARMVPHASIREIAAPELVPLVEAGITAGPVARDAVMRACEPLLGRIDALVLGCTHYPLLTSTFAAVFGDGVALIDPALVQAKAAVDLVRTDRLPPGSGVVRFVTSGEREPFVAGLHRLIPLPGDAHIESLQPAG